MKLNYLFFFILFINLCNSQIITITDSNFKTKLLGANTTNIIAKNLSGNYFKIDANSDGEIQQSEADNVLELYLNYPLNGNNYYISDLSGIINFVNLTKLDLKYNNIVSLNINGMQYLSYLDCANNGQYLNTLIIENLPSLETLKCQSAGSNTNNPIYSLNNLPSLKHINFGSCKFSTNTLDNITTLEEIYGYAGFKSTVTTIDLSNNPNLKIVELSNNNFNNIVFNQNNIIESLKVASNYLTTFNKTLFNNLKVLDLSWNRITNLDVSNLLTLEDLNCNNAYSSFSNNLTSINVQGCQSLNKLICSDNLIQNLDLSNLTNLIYLDCSGNYSVFTNNGLQSISLQNCINLNKIIADSNDYLTELDLSCSNNYSEIRVQNCSNLERINLKNGANESSMYAGLFSFYSCPNLNLIGVDFDEIFPFFPNTIQQSPYLNFTPNCKYNTVIGNVSFDIEGDGCQNNIGIEGIKIESNCPNQACFTFSDSSGNFVFYTQANSITLTPSNVLFPLFDFGLTSLLNLNFSSTNTLINIDLCLAPNTVHNDLEVSIIPLNIARPGFDSHYKVIYKNKGNQIQSGVINLSFDDSIMDLISSSPNTSVVSTNNLNWNFSSLMPFETREINLTLSINSSTEIPPVNSGDILNYVTTITDNSDETPNDNISVLNETVVNSYDPNNKICFEGVTISTNAIGEYIHYVINFENNGTANAQKIVVRDIIDISKFDISSLTPIKSSHNVQTRISEPNVAEFIFNNIDLPFDDANNNGYIAFKIKTRSNLTNGDYFSNSANIYFDYNYPILTNEYTTTIENNLNNIFIDKKEEIITFPNPVRNTLFFDTEINISKIEIFDITGRYIGSNEVINNEINLNNLNNGIYILKIQTENRMINTRIIKE